MEIQKRKLGKTGVDVTLLGLGGEGVLKTFGNDYEAYALINRALDPGVNYFESARAYSGSESYYGKALLRRSGLSTKGLHMKSWEYWRCISHGKL